MLSGIKGWERGARQIAAAGEKDVNGWYHSAPLAHETVTVSPEGKRLFQFAQRERGYKRPVDVPFYYIGGWVTTILLCEAIKLAIEEVGYKNLTGRAVRDGLASIKDFDPELGIPPITMSDSKPYWNRGQYIEQFQQGSFVRLSDWIENVYNLEF